MRFLYQNRAAAGNICLVLFVTFLMTTMFVAFGPVEGASALNDSDIYNGDPTGTYNSVILQPVTDATFDSILDQLQAKINSGDYSVSKVAYKTYEQVYSQVYGIVYKYIVYLIYGSPDVTRFDNWSPTNVNDIYGNSLAVVFQIPKPPEPSGGGGGGGGISLPATPTDTGTVVVNPNTGTAAVAVDGAKIGQMLSQQPAGSDIVIGLPPGTAQSVTEARVDIPIEVASDISEASRNLVINTGDAVMTLPPAALDVPELREALQTDPKATVEFKVKEVTTTPELDQALKQPDNQNLAPVGKTFEFTMVVNTEEGQKPVTSFNRNVVVGIPYDPAALNGASPDQLGVYKVTVNGLEYRYSWVDEVNHLIYFETPGFSVYTLVINKKTFTDLTGHWAKADVEAMAAKQIVKGLTDTTFGPDAAITRAQAAALLQRILGLPAVNPPAARFSDVASTDWYYGAVEAAAGAGLVNGYDDGTFKPDAMISREELAVMVVRAMKAGGKTVTLTADQTAAVLGKFQDAGQIQPWAQEATAIAVQQGIVNGRTADGFDPTAGTTRAEATVMLKRLLVSLGRF